MSESDCRYEGREELLIGYLYDDPGDTAVSDRHTFAAHLGTCGVCRRELEGLGVVRERLGQWTPPEPQALAAPQRHTRATPAPLAERHWWQEVPAWAQVAAALLFLGVSAGIANLDVTYDRDGLAMRTGWSSPTGPAAPAPAAAGAAAAEPWRAELTNLDTQLRAEIRATSQRAADAAAAARPSRDVDEAEVLRRVRTLINASERKEESELALRVAEMFRDLQVQRQADLAKIDRSLGLIRNDTGFEVMRQRERLNSLAVRVSQTR